MLKAHPEISEKLKEFNKIGIALRNEDMQLTSEGTEVQVPVYRCPVAKKLYPLSKDSQEYPVVNFNSFYFNPNLLSLLDNHNYAIEKDTTIELPKLCLHEFEGERFNLTNKNSILILYREWMANFIDYYYGQVVKQNRIVALTGPKGIGKSFTLYLLCAKLRKDGYKVLYLPSLLYLADSFMSVGSRANLSKELYFAFPEESAISIIRNYEKNEKITLNETILELKDIYNDRVVLIFDQLNTLFDNENQKKVESLLKSLACQIPIVVSFSDDCKIETKDRYYLKYKAVDFELKEEEMEAFIKTVDPGATYSDEQMKAVLDATGGFPLDVATVMKKSGLLDKKIAEFNSDALTEYYEGLKKFVKEQSKYQDSIKMNMYGIILLNGKRSTSFFHESEIDKKIVQRMYHNKGQFEYKIVNPTAWNAIWKLLTKSIKLKNIDDGAREVYYSLRSTRARGCAWAYYLITRSLILSKLIINSDLSFTNFDFQFVSVANMSRNLFSKKVLVFLPINEEYAVNDFYVYVPKTNNEKSKLYGVRITLHETPQEQYESMMLQLKNVNSQFSFFLYSLSQCFDEEALPEYYQIYVTKNEICVDEELNYYLTNFKEMVKDYPALNVMV